MRLTLEQLNPKRGSTPTGCFQLYDGSNKMAARVGGRGHAYLRVKSVVQGYQYSVDRWCVEQKRQ